MSAAALPPPRRVRTRHATLPSFGLALAMHAVLFGGLLYVVRWHTQDPAPVVAELWAANPNPTPVVEVPPPPPPPPPPKVEPQPEPPKPAADIVTKEEKKPPPKKEEPKVEEKKPPPKREDPKKDVLADLLKKQEAKARAERDAVRQAEGDRIAQQMRQDTAIPSDAAIPSQQSRGSGAGDDSYRNRLAALIKPRIVYVVPEGTSPSAYAEVQVDLLPTGEVVAIKFLKPSGLPEYDAAVERAIRRTDPFPRKPDGTVDRTIVIRFRPVDVQN
jgi:colicin import membrane protein